MLFDIKVCNTAFLLTIGIREAWLPHALAYIIVEFMG